MFRNTVIAFVSRARTSRVAFFRHTFTHVRPMRGALMALVVVAFSAACGTDRIPVVDETDPAFGRFEAPDADNACVTDLDCTSSGCSGEVCAAEPLVSTCEVIAVPEGACGCVDGACQWWTEPVALQNASTDVDS